jgi:hypothetical protein
MSTKWKATLASAVGALLVMAAAAQSPANSVIEGMAANNKQLRQYTYKQRSETYHQGELKNTTVDEIHYNPLGERVGIPIDQHQAAPEAPSRGPGHRLIAKKIEKEKEEMKDYIDRLKALAERYPGTDSGKLKDAIAKAEIITGGGSGLTRIRMRDYVKPGDSMTMSFDQATKRPVKTEISTFLDGGPVSIVVAFDQIPDGPNYPSRIVITSATKQIEIRVFTYEYRL